MINSNLNKTSNFHQTNDLNKQIEMSSFPKELAERVQAQRPVIGNGDQPTNDGEQKTVKKGFFAAIIARIVRAFAWLFGSKTEKPLELPEPASTNIPPPPPPPLPPKKEQKPKEKTTEKPVTPPQDTNSKAQSDIETHLRNALRDRRRIWGPDDEDETPTPVESNPSFKTKLTGIIAPPTIPPAPEKSFDLNEAKKEAAPMRKNLLGEISEFNKTALKKAEATPKEETQSADIYKSIMKQIEKKQL